jgi:hypothetical protein
MRGFVHRGYPAAEMSRNGIRFASVSVGRVCAWIDATHDADTWKEWRDGWLGRLATLTRDLPLGQVCA